MRLALAAAAAALVTAPAQAQTGDDYRGLDDVTQAMFAAHHVETGPAFTVPASIAVETPVGVEAAREAAARGVNFAGRHTLVTIGCGTECQATYLVNPRPGDYPVSLTSGHGIAFRSDSRLLIVNPPGELQYFGPDSVPARLHPQCFVYQGGAFGQIGCAGYPD